MSSFISESLCHIPDFNVTFWTSFNNVASKKLRQNKGWKIAEYLYLLTSDEHRASSPD